MNRLSNWYGAGVPLALMLIAAIVVFDASPPGSLFAIVLAAAGYWFTTDQGRRLLMRLQESLS